MLTLSGVSRYSAFELFSYREYLDIREHTKSYDGVVASGDLVPVGFTLDPNATPRVKGGMLVSGNFFQTLGVRAALGRPLVPGDDERFAGQPVIVLSHVGWKKLFAGEPTVIGRIANL